MFQFSHFPTSTNFLYFIRQVNKRTKVILLDPNVKFGGICSDDKKLIYTVGEGKLIEQKHVLQNVSEEEEKEISKEREESKETTESKGNAILNFETTELPLPNKLEIKFLFFDKQV
jgi:hypothetical protein